MSERDKFHEQLRAIFSDSWGPGDDDCGGELDSEYMLEHMADYVRDAVAAERKRCVGIANEYAATWEDESKVAKPERRSFCGILAAAGRELAKRIRSTSTEFVEWYESAESTHEDTIWLAQVSGVDLRAVCECHDYERGGSIDWVVEWTAVVDGVKHGPFPASSIPAAKAAAVEFARELVK